MAEIYHHDETHFQDPSTTPSAQHHEGFTNVVTPGEGDIPLQCKDCQSNFLFTMGEQEFYNLKGFSGQPTRCKPCRAQKKASRENQNSQTNYNPPMQMGMPMVMIDPFGVPFYTFSNPQQQQQQQHAAPMKPCHAFMRGECMYGNECRFSHDTFSHFNGFPAYAPTFPMDPNFPQNYSQLQLPHYRRQNKSKNPCFAFQRGSCTYGDNCRYTHDDSLPTSSDSNSSSSQGQPQQQQIQQSPQHHHHLHHHQHQQHSQLQQQQLQQQHHIHHHNQYQNHNQQQLQQQQRPKAICHAFQRGECTYGESCRFTHDTHGSTSF